MENIRELGRLLEVKDRLKNAIESKGILIDVGLVGYGDKIREISNLKSLPNGFKLGYSLNKNHDWTDFNNIDDFSYMFYHNDNLQIAPITKDKRYGSLRGTFSYCGSLSNIDALSNWDTSSVTDMSYMFYKCSSLPNIDELSNWDTSSVTNMERMFATSSTLTSWEEGAPRISSYSLLNWDTSSVTNMSRMFEYSGLIDYRGFYNWDTSSVTDMSRMFDSAARNYGEVDIIDSLPDIDVSYLSNWDVSNVVNMEKMFSTNWKLTNMGLLDWNTSSVTNMVDMFNDCRFMYDAPKLNTMNVTDMLQMFSDCDELVNVPLYDMVSVIRTTSMFRSCRSLTNLGGFKDLKVSLNLSASSLLTHESLMNVINNLAVVTNSPTLTLGEWNINKLAADEIAIATSKGWIVN